MPRRYSKEIVLPKSCQRKVALHYSPVVSSRPWIASPSPGCPRDRNGPTKSNSMAIGWGPSGVLVERPFIPGGRTSCAEYRAASIGRTSCSNFSGQKPQIDEGWADVSLIKEAVMGLHWPQP